MDKKTMNSLWPLASALGFPLLNNSMPTVEAMVGRARILAAKAEGDIGSVTSGVEQVVDENDVEIQYFAIHGPPFPNDAARRILQEILPEWVEYFLKKSADYGDHHGELGLRGEFTGIWRKIWKLRRGIWDGEPMKHEQPEEMLDDLIGSAFLSKDTIRNK